MQLLGERRCCHGSLAVGKSRFPSALIMSFLQALVSLQEALGRLDTPFFSKVLDFVFQLKSCKFIRVWFRRIRYSEPLYIGEVKFFLGVYIDEPARTQKCCAIGETFKGEDFQTTQSLVLLSGFWVKLE
jgi:hypothetical protein